MYFTGSSIQKVHVSCTGTVEDFSCTIFGVNAYRGRPGIGGIMFPYFIACFFVQAGKYSGSIIPRFGYGYINVIRKTVSTAGNGRLNTTGYTIVCVTLVIGMPDDLSCFCIYFPDRNGGRIITSPAKAERSTYIYIQVWSWNHPEHPVPIPTQGCSGSDT